MQVQFLSGSLWSVPIFGRPLVKRFALCYGTVVGLSVLSVTLVYCGQTVGWIKMKIGAEVGLGHGHIVLDGDPAPLPPKGGIASPTFWSVYCGQKARCIKIPLGMEVDLGAGDIVLDGGPSFYQTVIQSIPDVMF